MAGLPTPSFKPLAPGEPVTHSYINALFNPNILFCIPVFRLDDYYAPITGYLTQAQKDHFSMLWRQVQEYRTSVQEHEVRTALFHPSGNVRSVGFAESVGDERDGQGNSNQLEREQVQQHGQAESSVPTKPRFDPPQTSAQLTYEQSLEYAVITHFFPPNLAAKPHDAVAHLQSTLFPHTLSASGSPLSPLVQQTIFFAQNGRLSPEQITQVKAAMPTQRHQAFHLQQASAPAAHVVAADRATQERQYSAVATAQQHSAIAAAQRGTPQSLPSKPRDLEVQHSFPTPPILSFVQASKEIHELRSHIALVEDHLTRSNISSAEREIQKQYLLQANSRLHQVIQSYLPHQHEESSSASVLATVAAQQLGVANNQKQPQPRSGLPSPPKESESPELGDYSRNGKQKPEEDDEDVKPTKRSRLSSQPSAPVPKSNSTPAPSQEIEIIVQGRFPGCPLRIKCRRTTTTAAIHSTVMKHLAEQGELKPDSSYNLMFEGAIIHAPPGESISQIIEDDEVEIIFDLLCKFKR
ncbi:hypothetical protein P7C70_g6975, partial [Phenoliferia sp. Uapishka_3]